MHFLCYRECRRFKFDCFNSIDYPIGSVLATPNGDSVGVIVTIKNKGLKNLTTCNISWTLNGIYKEPNNGQEFNRRF
jgi:hypothetical protein